MVLGDNQFLDYSIIGSIFNLDIHAISPILSSLFININHEYIFFRIALSRAYIVSFRKKRLIFCYVSSEKHHDKQAIKSNKSR